MSASLHGIPIVSVEGIDLHDAMLLSALRVVQQFNAPARCEISWQCSTLDSQLLEQIALKPGQPLSVHIQGQSEDLFSGQLSAIEHVHEPAGGFVLRVRAYDDLIALQSRQSIQTLVEVSTGELLRALIEPLGLDVDCETEGPIWPRIVPRFEHDLALLRAYAARSGLFFTLSRGTVRLFAPDSKRSPSVALQLGQDLLEARFEQNHVRPVGQVDVLGWDIHTGQLRRGHSSASNPDLHALRSLQGTAVESDAEAQARAATELFRCRSLCTSISGIAEGMVQLLPGCALSIHGMSSQARGPHLISSVVHSVDAQSGYVAEFNTRLEPTEAEPGAASLLLGEVSDVDDPAQRGRVQVVLCAYDQALSTWMMVMQAGAGANKGFIALPEVGDLVLVALPDGDPSRGIVLGGVYREDGPPQDPAAARDASQARPYTLASRGGQRIEINDADGSIRLRNASGSSLALTPEGLTLSAVGELLIEAPGRRLRLAAHHIDLERR